MKRLFVMSGIIALLFVSGCRGYRSENPPIHPNPNLDWQAKITGQQLPLLPPDGTVAWGNAEGFVSEEERNDYLESSDRTYYEGKTSDSAWVQKIPVPVTEKLMLRGQERFNIYCAICHDKAGTGQGTVIKRGFVPPPNFSDARVVAYSDGELFDIITNGVRTMPSYGKQVPVQDRWAIVAYVRALQKMRNVSSAELPEELKTKLK